MKINYEKIRNFNQLLLAIAGLIGVLFLAIACIGFTIEFFSFSFGKNERQGGVIAHEESTEPLEDTLRKQIISFRDISILDSTNQIFILPVSQANLDKEENVDDLTGFTNMSRPYSKLFKNGQLYGYNNIVLCYSKEKANKVVFDFKVSFLGYSKFEKDNSMYLVVKAASSDSNHDGYLNGSDFQELFVYDLLGQKLHNVPIGKNKTVLSIHSPLKSNMVIIELGVDRNADFKFDSESEPSIFYELNFKKMQLEEMVGEKEITKLQKILEGGK